MSSFEAVILSAVRTPIGSFQGSLKSFSTTRLGALVVEEAVRRAGVDPHDVEETIMGNVLAAGLGQNPARQAALGGGLPDTVGALTGKRTHPTTVVDAPVLRSSGSRILTIGRMPFFVSR